MCLFFKHITKKFKKNTKNKNEIKNYLENTLGSFFWEESISRAGDSDFYNLQLQTPSHVTEQSLAQAQR